MGDVGVAYLPSISSCFLCPPSFMTEKEETSAPSDSLHARRTLLEHLRETPLTSWNDNDELRNIFCLAFEDTDDIVYGSPMFDDLLSTIDDSPMRSITEIGPSTQRLLDSLHNATFQKKKKHGNEDDDDEVDKVMEGLTVVKEIQPENWIQCEHDTCMKWRKIPVEIDVTTLPEPWYCTMNKWDPLKCACNAAEDTYDDDNEYQYVKEDISQTIMPGEKIDLFCTQKGGWSEATVKETRKVEGKDDDSMEAFCHYLVSSCTSLSLFSLFSLLFFQTYLLFLFYFC